MMSEVKRLVVRFAYRKFWQVAQRTQCDPDAYPDNGSHVPGELWHIEDGNQLWVHLAVEAPLDEEARAYLIQKRGEYQNAADLHVQSLFPGIRLIT
jgi:hypothetical protein